MIDLTKYLLIKENSYKDYVRDFINFILENKDLMISKNCYKIQFKAFLDFLISKGVISRTLSQQKIKEIFEEFQNYGLKIEKINRSYYIDFEEVIRNEDW